MNKMLQRVTHFQMSLSVGIQLVCLMAKLPRKQALRTKLSSPSINGIFSAFLNKKESTEAHSGP